MRTDIKSIAEHVIMAARENAFQTAHEEGVEGPADESPMFAGWVHATAEMIIDDLAGWNPAVRGSYGCDKPLTAKQLDGLRALVLR